MRTASTVVRDDTSTLMCPSARGLGRWLCLGVVAVCLVFTWIGRIQTDANALLVALIEKRPPRPRLECDVDNATNSCKPGFMLIGVQKSGSSTLYAILRQHPQIKLPLKELLWWNGDRPRPRCNVQDKEVAHYLKMFPRVRPKEKVLTGEFSVTYMHCHCCAAQFSHFFPQLKIGTLLREPIGRSFSRWKEQRAMGRTVFRTFDEAVDKEVSSLQQCMTNYSVARRCECVGKLNIVGYSLYSGSIRNWRQYYPKSRFLVMYLDELHEDPQKVVNLIQYHLGLKSHAFGDVLHEAFNTREKYGWGFHKKNREATGTTADDEIHAETGQRLLDFFRPDLLDMLSLAEAREIAPLPKAWMKKWALTRGKVW
eukprot:CAMPEP_0194519402 /NCGR_PEP_ID=MMETSP0253-20130528/53052_1 /TAXON_ID=2966 /ORGANISM="Noctiluca scintillans" /LENGTH=367 /DNA_ID=CAMNT_0039363535 /DNA_START=57 /DNA_END=1157 /DNA_ORIENTATION=-